MGRMISFKMKLSILTIVSITSVSLAPVEFRSRRASLHAATQGFFYKYSNPLRECASRQNEAETTKYMLVSVCRVFQPRQDCCPPRFYPLSQQAFLQTFVCH